MQDPFFKELQTRFFNEVRSSKRNMPYYEIEDHCRYALEQVLNDTRRMLVKMSDFQINCHNEEQNES